MLLQLVDQALFDSLSQMMNFIELYSVNHLLFLLAK
jgi:hypothetical protein